MNESPIPAGSDANAAPSVRRGKRGEAAHVTTERLGWRTGLRRGIALAVAAVALFAPPMAIPAQVLPAVAAEPLPGADGKPLAFEVVSVREEELVTGAPSPVQMESTADGYRMKGVPLMALIQIAYIPSQGATHFGPNQITRLWEPLDSARYDIEAKVSEADLPQWNDPALQPGMLRAMLQAMLADRFKLAVHRETKIVPVFEMTAGRKGPKFRSSEGASPDEIAQRHPGVHVLILRSGAIAATGPNPGQQWLFGATMLALAEFLSTMAGRPIEDKTGLTGKYDITWQLELPTQDAGADRPRDFFTQQIIYVVQDQLGLKLSPADGPMESLVIDHVERPSEN